MSLIYNFYVLTTSADISNVRYVGVTTKTVQQRLYGHKYCSMHEEKRYLPVHKWMYTHYQKGEDILITQIDFCTSENWEEREKYWISHYKDLGYNLLNISEGGYGVITKEMREISSIERSRKKHEKAVIALNKDGSIYKEFESSTKAAEELNLNSKTSINNALKGRSKSAGGYLWVFKENYDSNISYTYESNKNGTTVYQFDINGLLIQKFPSKRYFDTLEGWSFNGIQTAIRDKKLYHDCYWSEYPIIEVSEYEPYFKYQELDPEGNLIAMYRSYEEISKKFNISHSKICTNVNKHKLFPNGNYISKL